MADQELPILAVTVIRIMERDAPRVTEAGACFFKGHTMLVPIDRGLDFAPCESHATHPEAPGVAPTVASVIVQTCAQALAYLR
jgi:hypothetical protein